MGRRGWLGIFIVFGVWLAVGLIDSCQMLILTPNPNKAPRWCVFAIGFSDWTQWALLVPVIVFLCRRFPLDRGDSAHLLLHAVSSLFFAVLVISVSVPMLREIQSYYREPTSPTELFEHLFMLKLVLYMMIYWLVVGVMHSMVFYARFRERHRAAARLENQLTQAQLEVLRMQLQPHFLFNTLHAISSLMHRDVELADRMIARLGELLRASLDNAGAAEVSLREELDFIAPYLEIEQTRIGPRLQVMMAIDLETLDARVPNLLLQPLVENAIKHGIAPQRANGTIEISARRNGDRLQLRVRDTGAGLSNGKVMKEGVGLGNTRARMQHLYGDDHTFTIAPVTGGPGVVVSLELPFREIETRNTDDLCPENADC